MVWSDFHNKKSNIC